MPHSHRITDTDCVTVRRLFVSEDRDQDSTLCTKVEYKGRVQKYSQRYKTVQVHDKVIPMNKWCIVALRIREYKGAY